MLVKRIAGATRNLGAPADWDGKDMSCCVLPILDVHTAEGNFMVSAWEPTPAELRAMQAGHSVNLGIRGSSHPVVFVNVPEADQFEKVTPAADVQRAGQQVTPSSALVLKYCELTNRSPLGTQAVSSSDGWVESTFYQVAERELQAMFAAQAALAQEGGGQ